jgi:hypothetical protein
MAISRSILGMTSSSIGYVIDFNLYNEYSFDAPGIIMIELPYTVDAGIGDGYVFDCEAKSLISKSQVLSSGLNTVTGQTAVVKITADEVSYTHLGNNVIARIPMTAPALNVNYNSPSDLIFKQRDYFGPVKIEKLHLRLVDRYGDTLDIQNNDYSVAIELTTTY